MCVQIDEFWLGFVSSEIKHNNFSLKNKIEEKSPKWYVVSVIYISISPSVSYAAKLCYKTYGSQRNGVKS